MFDFVFDIPLIIIGPVIILLLCLFAFTGVIFVRRFILPRLHIVDEDSHFTSAMVPSVMVFYGLAVALIAVSVFQTYSDVSKIVSSEATSLAMLYRDVSSYPEPIRTELQNDLRNYTEFVIYKAWPSQKRGQMPGEGVEIMNHFQATLVSYEPITEGQKLLHGEALRAYNQMIQDRRKRLDAVGTGLPGVMWSVIILGSFICLIASFFFKVEDVHLHLIQILLLATFMGLVIFMILELDRPFHGDLGLSPEPYQLIYDQLMKSKP